MNNRTKTIGGAGIAALAMVVIVAGCAGSKSEQPAAAPGAPAGQAATPTGSESGTRLASLSGSELWSQNCALCHNSRSPTDYSDAQWSVAVMHMRIQARLNGEEERKIRQFLQASN